MKALEAILFSPAVLIAISLIAIGFAGALCRIPKDTAKRKNMAGLLWVACFVVISTWIMQQQSNVLAGGIAQTREQPVGVAIKGVIRYVSEEQAYRYDSGMWVLLIAALACMTVYKLAVGANEA
jgi:hypothetical protein